MKYFSISKHFPEIYSNHLEKKILEVFKLLYLRVKKHNILPIFEEILKV